MARPMRGADVAQMAREMIARARTVEQLRQTQAVALPLLFGLSLEQTAVAIGRSRVWTCQLRNRFLAGGDLRRRSAAAARRAPAADHESGAGAADAGALSGAGAQWRDFGRAAESWPHSFEQFIGVR